MGMDDIDTMMNSRLLALTEQTLALGLPLPDVGDVAPALSIRQPLKDMARNCALNILSSGEPKIFLQEHNIVTIDEQSGVAQKMTSSAFRSFVEHFMVVYEKKNSDTGRPMQCLLPCELSRDILESADFRVRLPRLRGVNLVKQPVWRPGKNGERGKYELLKPGYDRESEIYTVRCLDKELDYDETWSLPQAFELLEERFRFFPWGGTEGVDPLKLKGVSFAVCVSAWLTLYGLSMLPKDTPTPLFLFNANEPGSGKSRMVEMIIFALYGYSRTLAWPKDKKENDKIVNTLDSLALSGGTYLFLDNLPRGYFESPLMDQWVTNTTHTARIFHSQALATVEKRAVTFMTGNGITLSDDLDRRALICDFWAEEAAVDATLPAEAIRITKGYIGEKKNRGEFLSALWALVRHAQEHPVKYEGETRGFEGWSERIASICISCGLADPLTRRELAGTGNTEASELKQLMTLVVEEFLVRPGRKAADVLLLKMVPIARKAGLFAGILATVDDMLREMESKRAFKPVLSSEGNELRSVSELTEYDRREQAAGYITNASMTGLFTKRVGVKMKGKTAHDKAGKAYSFGKRAGAHNSTFEIVAK